MSWNRPTESTDSKNAGKARHNRVIALIIAGLVVIAGVVVVLIVMRSGESQSVSKSDTEGRASIKEVAPARPTVAQAEPATNIVKKPWWKTNNTNGFTKTQLAAWKFYNGPPPSYVARRDQRKKADFAIFDHRSENLIASYLALKPGQGMIGTPNLRGIDEDFLESLKTPIIVSKDDTPEVAELKRAMNQTKIDLKARIDAGEKLADILMESHKEAQRLAMVKEMIRAEVKAQIKEAKTSEEVEDYVNSANKLLAEKGIAPISFGPIVKQKLLLKTADAPKPKAKQKKQ